MSPLECIVLEKGVKTEILNVGGGIDVSMRKAPYLFTGSKVQGFKVPFSSLDCIWDAYLREKRQLRQA